MSTQQQPQPQPTPPQDLPATAAAPATATATSARHVGGRGGARTNSVALGGRGSRQPQQKQNHHGHQQTPQQGPRGGRGRGGAGRHPHPPQQQYQQQPQSQPQWAGRGGPGQQQQQQINNAPSAVVHTGSGLPHGHVPAYLPGSSSLVEELDQRILIVLRDGKHFIGILSSFDQFSNFVLLEAVERRILVSQPRENGGRLYYHDIPLGLYVVRGDSVVIMGQVNTNDDESDSFMKRVSLEELERLQEEKANNNNTNNQDDVLEWDFDNDLVA